MNASIDKVFAPLITAGGTALIAILTGQAVDVSSVQTAIGATAAGLVTAGLVYYLRYSEHFPKKALANLVPLALALFHYLQTGEINEPEILFAMQAVVGFAWTYVAKYIPFVPVAQPPSAGVRPHRP